MEDVIHGGDIYRNQITADYSVNINPLGIPERIRTALTDAVNLCHAYPDIHATELITDISRSNGADTDTIVCGNGASELFVAVMHAIRPKRVLIPIPSFYGYERSARAVDAVTFFYELQEECNFCLTDTFLKVLTENLDVLFLANPNNPTGQLIDRALLYKILKVCKERQILVILDESFIEFTGEESLIKEKSLTNEQALQDYTNVIVIRSFTKLYAIPGVRLGYLMCSDRHLCERIQAQLPEWNLSCFAQAAGLAAIQEINYAERTEAYVKQERDYLEHALAELGIRVYPGDANFLLLQSKFPLYEKLLEQGILIRDCRNFRGLEQGYYRIAVKKHEENQNLVKKVEKIIGKA